MELRYGNLVTQARDALNLEIPLLRVVDVCSSSCSRKSLNPPQPWVTDGSKQGLWVPTPSQSTPSQKGQDPALFPHRLPLLFREREVSNLAEVGSHGTLLTGRQTALEVKAA